MPDFQGISASHMFMDEDEGFSSGDLIQLAGVSVFFFGTCFQLSQHAASWPSSLWSYDQTFTNGDCAELWNFLVFAVQMSLVLLIGHLFLSVINVQCRDKYNSYYRSAPPYKRRETWCAKLIALTELGCALLKFGIWMRSRYVCSNLIDPQSCSADCGQLYWIAYWGPVAYVALTFFTCVFQMMSGGCCLGGMVMILCDH
mmetsp:Transcript_6080/g.11634  ORF Transcript_6080/g.11634 Transcript_6080/m.11634 type:complete len:200 (+) Transcript_6080:50-649(+)